MIRSFSTAVQSDPLFRKRTPEARLLYYTLYMHPGNHLCGVFVLSPEHMAIDVGLTIEATQKAIRELLTYGWLEVDEERELVWVPEMTKRVGDVSAPTNSVGKAISKYLHSFKASPLLKKVADTLSIPYRHPIGDPMPWGVDRVLSGSGSETGSGSGGVKTPSGPGASSPALPMLWDEFKRRAGKSLGAYKPNLLTIMGLPQLQHDLLVAGWMEAQRAGWDREGMLRVADWIAAGGLEWHGGAAYNYLAKNVLVCLSKAQEWHDAGRPSPKVRGQPAKKPERVYVGTELKKFEPPPEGFPASTPEDEKAAGF